MKKLLILAALAGLGILIWREVTAERVEREIWREVTDPVE